MSTGRRFRVGLVGAGYVAPFHVAALLRLPQVGRIGIADLDPGRTRALAARFPRVDIFPSLAAMAREGLDVVHVLTPPDAHAAVALEAMRHGCHVLIEKPLATSVEDCDLLIDEASRLGRTAAVNHSLLGDPLVRRALAALRSGRLGEVVSADFFCSSIYPPYAGGPLPPQYRDGGYPFRDLGVHALYLLAELLGPIEELQADFWTRGGDPNLSFDEWRCQVRCERGSGQIQLSWNIRPLQYWFAVHGTRASLRVDLAQMLMTARRALPLPSAAERVANTLAEALPPLWQVSANVARFATGRVRPYQGLHAIVRDFYESMSRGEPPPVTLERGREAVRWVETAACPADEAKRRRLARHAGSGTPAIAVTGASGFVGLHLVRRLLREGHRLRVLVRREPSGEPLASPQVEVVLGDLGDPAAVDRAIRGATLVYHLGAATQGGAAEHEAGTVVGTRNVVESCLAHKVPKLVYVSSLSVLDWAGSSGGPPLDESCSLEPRPGERGLYTRAKLAAEELVRRAVEERGLPAVIIRPGQIFGLGKPLKAVVGAIELGDRMLLLGRGADAEVPLVHVADVVEALVLAARSERFDGAIYHVVGQGRITQRELAKRVAAAQGCRPLELPQGLVWLLAAGLAVVGTAVKRPVPLTPYRLRSGQAQLRFDCSRIRSELGWAPGREVEAAIRECLEAEAGK